MDGGGKAEGKLIGRGGEEALGEGRRVSPNGKKR